MVDFPWYFSLALDLGGLLEATRVEIVVGLMAVFYIGFIWGRETK